MAKRNKNKKVKLTEGKIAKFFDKLVFGILNDANERIVNSLRNDPEMEKALSDFEKSSKEFREKFEDYMMSLDN